MKYSAAVIHKLLEETKFHELPKGMQKLMLEKYGTQSLKEAMGLSMMWKVMEEGAVSVSAYNALHDRLEGKPNQTMELDVTNAPDMTDRELARRVASTLTGGIVSPQESAEGAQPQQGDTTNDQTT